jgi:hypothetical protein
MTWDTSGLGTSGSHLQSWIPGGSNNSRRPYLKNTQHTQKGWVAQVVEHLPSKCEALNSDPSTEKGKEKKKKTQQDEVRGLIDKQTWSTTL